MIKGWRNNPEWVRLHAENEKKKYESIMKSMRLRYEIDELLEVSRRNREAPLVRMVSEGY